jgi:hypothetical protein
MEKLEGMNNYNNRKFAVEMLLIHEGLWGCVEGTETDAKKDTRARAKIYLMVKPSAYAHLRPATSAKEAWDNLKKVYEDKGLTRRHGLLRKLFNVKLRGCRKMEEYVTEIMSISQQLADISAAVDDEFIDVVMLSVLPTECSPVIMAENSVKSE